jgi:hypothetical protein
VEEFSKDKSKAYELSIRCKVCDSEKCKKWNRKNKEHVKERNTKYYQNNKEYFKEYQKQWKENNKEYYKERDKKYRKNNKEHIKEYHKQHRENNKQNNLQYIFNIVEQINPMFKQLNLPIYGCIYAFKNIKTGHTYIGQTIQPLKERYKSNIVQGWIKERLEYDTQKFKEELIEEDIVVTEVLDVAFCQYHLDKLEAYYIDKFNSQRNGYNIQGGNYHSDDGIEEFNQILLKHNLKFTDGKLIEVQ